MKKCFILWGLSFLLLMCLAVRAQADGSLPAMTINGQTDHITVDFNAFVTLRLLVPDQATALKVDAEQITHADGSACDPESERGEWNEWYGRDRLTPCIEQQVGRFYTSGTWQVTASCLTADYEDGEDLNDGYPWTILATVNVTVSKWQSRLSPPSVSLESASVAQGDFVRASLSSFQHKDEWYWYELRQLDEESGDWNWISQQEIILREGLTSSFAVSTADLAPGAYQLWVRTEAVGYEDNGTFLPFTVTENSTLKDGISLSTNTVQTGVPVSVGLRAQGADQLMVMVTRDGDPYWSFDPYIPQSGADAVIWLPEFSQKGTYRMTLTAYEGNDSRTVGDAVLTVTSSDSLAGPVFSGFPGILSAGQGLSGSLVLDDRAEQCVITLNYRPEDDDWVLLYDAFLETSMTTQTLSLPASLFTQDGQYHLHVCTRAVGLDESYSEYWFIRSADPAGDVTLKVNGTTQPVSIMTSEDVQLEIISPSATAARVMIGDHWEYRGDPESFSFTTSFNRSGDYALIAQVTTAEAVWNSEGFDWGSFRWEELDWSAYSQAVPVHVETPYGRLDQPAVTLDQYTVAQGDWLHASVEGQDHDDWYWAQVRSVWRDPDGNINWSHVMDCYGNPAEDGYRIPAAVLTPGDYLLTVGAEAVGWEGAETSVPFTVTGSASPLPEAALFFPCSSILTSQEISFCTYAPDADQITVDVSLDGDAYWNNHYEDDDGVNTWSWNSSQSGSYTFVLRALHNGESIGEDSFVLNVEAPYGELTEITVPDLPAAMAAGTALNTSFSADPRAMDFSVRLICCPDDGPWDTLYDNWRRASQTGAASLSFPATYFSRPGIYRLEISSAALGYNSAHLSRQILVTQPDMVQSLTLTVEADEIFLHQNVPVTVTAPEGVTAVRLWSSSNNGWDCRADDGNGFEWYWGFHNGGNETLIAQGTTDPAVTEWLNDPSHDGMWDFDWSRVDWTLSSSAVTVNVIKYGDLNPPQVTFPQGTTVERGQMLQLQLEPVDNAYSYGVQIRRAGDDDWNWLIDMDYPLSEITLISVPTDSLEAGSYMLHIDPRQYGWHGDSVGYPFTVTQGPSWTGEAVFRVGPTQILTREEITYSVYAPGAEEVMVCDESMENQWSRAFGESLVEHMMLNWEKIYRLKAYARYPDGQEWQQVGDTAEVNVSAPCGAMGMTVQAPGTIRTTDELSIALRCDFKGTDGYAECYLNDMNGQFRELEITGGNAAGSFICSLPADTLEVGAYDILAYAFPGAPGYEMAVSVHHFAVSDGTLEPVLTVDPGHAEIFDDIAISLSVPGATAVAICSGMNDMGRIYGLGDTLYDGQTAWHDGEYTFCGLYTTQAIDPGAQGFSWENVAWEGASCVVTLTVNPPTGELEPMNAVLDSHAVKRGDRIRVRILNDNPGLDVSYGAHLQPAGEGGTSDCAWYGPDPDDGKTIWVDTLEAEPGEYVLMVSANARGCLGVNTMLPVTISGADNGLQMSLRDTEVLTGSMLQATGFANGAVHLSLDAFFENGSWDPQHDETDSDCMRTEVFCGEHPDTLVLDLTATYADGAAETLRRRITVTSPKGPVHPTILMNSDWHTGMDLDFTVTVEQDAQYVVSIQEPGMEESAFAQFVPPGSPEKRFLLPAGEYVFHPGKPIVIRVIAAGTGYDGSETSTVINRPAQLDTLTLPAGLRTIGEEAFAGVAAQKIVVPSGVTSIESGAFSGCPNLVEMVLPAGIASIAPDILGTSGPVYVYGQPGSDLEAYSAAVDNLYFIAIYE